MKFIFGKFSGKATPAHHSKSRPGLQTLYIFNRDIKTRALIQSVLASKTVFIEPIQYFLYAFMYWKRDKNVQNRRN